MLILYSLHMFAHSKCHSIRSLLNISKLSSMISPLMTLFSACIISNGKLPDKMAVFSLLAWKFYKIAQTYKTQIWSVLLVSTQMIFTFCCLVQMGQRKCTTGFSM
ncbi:hypothetical protein RHMOL_Rhmol04G0248200 [Rhododendron molle]|uniref:Uncharacterized protein n=1 Tax=Rhododendron molle TaxID=49168 RepID=A0ACC0P5C0_RHOML|nr:hypothetical protein RHMOL_Rhmol04G0248200 [Rhododendron molle]